jgi:hypothetical protein
MATGFWQRRSRGGKTIYSGERLGRGVRVRVGGGESDSGGRHRVRGRLPAKRLQLTGGPRLSVARRVGSVPMGVAVSWDGPVISAWAESTPPGLFSFSYFFLIFLFLLFLFSFISFSTFQTNQFILVPKLF